MSRRLPGPTVTLLLLLALWAPAVLAQPTPAERLEAAHAEYERSRREDVDLPALVEELETLADLLVTDGADSLAIVALQDLGALHAQRGRLEVSRERLLRALDLAERAGRLATEADLRGDLAVNAALSGDFEGMIASTRAVIPLARELGDEDLERRCWYNLCVAYTKLGRTPDALAAVRRALDLTRRLQNLPRLASAFAMLGEIQMNLGQLEFALDSADSAVHYSRRSGEKLPLSAALLLRGRLRSDLGDPGSATAAVEEAVGLRRDSGLEVYLPLALLVRAQIELALDSPEDCLDTVDELLPLVETQGDPTQIMETRLIAALAKLRLDRLDRAESDLLALQLEFERLQEEMQEDASAAGLYRVGGEAYAALAEIHSRRGDLHAAWAELERGSAPQLRRRRGEEGTRMELSRLQEFLGRRHARLLHFADSSQLPLTVMVIGPESVERHTLGPPAQLATRSRALLRQLVDEPRSSSLSQDLGALGEELLGPVAPALDEPGVEHVFVIAPSALAGFPLEALPLSRFGGEALGDRLSVSYLPYAGFLENRPFVGPEAPERMILAVADPELMAEEDDPTRGSSLGALPFAREEIAIFPAARTRALVGAEATPARVRAALEDTDVAVVHLATHALVSHDAPHNSRLVLAGESGALRASEIESLSLGADLVTLSACRTHEGYAYMGEGAFSLARSFLVAGADVVVSSLWDVEDQVTAHFMRHFYAALARESTPGGALRSARLALRDEGASLRDRMAFVVTGNHPPTIPELAGAVGAPDGRPLLRWGLWAGALGLLAAVVIQRRFRRN